MQGSHPVPQPLTDEDGNILLWNGDVFYGPMVNNVKLLIFFVLFIKHEINFYSKRKNYDLFEGVLNNYFCSKFEARNDSLFLIRKVYFQLSVNAHLLQMILKYQ